MGILPRLFTRPTVFNDGFIEFYQVMYDPVRPITSRGKYAPLMRIADKLSYEGGKWYGSKYPIN